MAEDKLVDSTQLDADLTSVANAIRTKGGTSVQMTFPSGFISAINNIPTGGGGYSCTNLLNGVEFTPGYINNSGGIASTTADKEIVSDYISVSDFSSLSVCLALYFPDQSSGWCAIGAYDENKTFKSRVTGSPTTPFGTASMTIPSGTAYIRVCFRSKNNVRYALLYDSDKTAFKNGVASMLVGAGFSTYEVS